jgi:hypothetical protein
LPAYSAGGTKNGAIFFHSVWGMFLSVSLTALSVELRGISCAQERYQLAARQVLYGNQAKEQDARMSERTPISLIVDDSCPLVHVFRCHWVDVHHRPPRTEDGRELAEVIPNDFLDRFCDVVEQRGMAGKFSIVPSPAGKGDIVQGIEGFDPVLTHAWLETARRRLGARFDFCPEGITHNLAVDLATGRMLPQGESEWSQHQTRETLTPYLIRQLELLRDAGIDATGVTSPWVFGIQVEPEYIAALAAAQKAVYDRDFSWYFLHMLADKPASRPWVALTDGTATLVSVPTTTDDVWWRTMGSPRDDPAWIGEIADELLTRDGRHGQIRRVLDAGGWPVLLTHWQSLFSNGVESGLAVLDEIGERVARTLSAEVVWVNCSEMAQRTVEPSATKGGPK